MPLWMRNLSRGNWRIWEDDLPTTTSALGIAGGITFEDISPSARLGVASAMSQQPLHRTVSMEEGKESMIGSDTWEPGTYEYPPRKFGVS